MTARATSDRERIREYYDELDNDHRGYDSDDGDDLGDEARPGEDNDDERT